jgi:MFS family permease
MAGDGSTDGDRLDRSTWLALFAMALGVFVIANDFTALSVAIPNIEHDLSTTLTKAQWVINVYALVFGVLIVTGRRLADPFGRKRVFMIGATICTLLAAGTRRVQSEVVVAARTASRSASANTSPAASTS